MATLASRFTVYPSLQKHSDPWENTSLLWFSKVNFPLNLHVWGFPTVAKRKRIWLVSMRMQVQSLALLVGWESSIVVSCDVDWRCSLNPVLLWLWYRPLAVSSNSTPGLGTSICHRCGPKKENKKLSVCIITHNFSELENVFSYFVQTPRLCDEWILRALSLTAFESLVKHFWWWTIHLIWRKQHSSAVSLLKWELKGDLDTQIIREICTQAGVFSHIPYRFA